MFDADSATRTPTQTSVSDPPRQSIPHPAPHQRRFDAPPPGSRLGPWGLVIGISPDSSAFVIRCSRFVNTQHAARRTHPLSPFHPFTRSPFPLFRSSPLPLLPFPHVREYRPAFAAIAVGRRNGRKSPRDRATSPRVRATSPRVCAASPRVCAVSPRDRVRRPRVRAMRPRVRAVSARDRADEPRVRATSPRVLATRPRPRTAARFAPPHPLP